jgi:hypothetical protein
MPGQDGRLADVATWAASSAMCRRVTPTSAVSVVVPAGAELGEPLPGTPPTVLRRNSAARPGGMGVGSGQGWGLSARTATVHGR